MDETPVETDAQPLQPRPEDMDTGVVDPRRPTQMPGLPNDYHFYQLLLGIGSEIPKETFDDFKYLYKGELKTRLMEKIKDTKELFTILEQRRFITPENMIHLQKLVMMIPDEQIQTKLMKRIYEYSTEHKAVYFRPCTDEPANGYRPIKFHIKSLEHHQYERSHVKNLVVTVASLTGLGMEEILPDGIELTNSIYITLLIPSRHYTLFIALLKDGIPLLSEMRVDMVTFDDETSIEASSGRKIEEKLPPKRESPDEKILRLGESLEVLQLKDIDLTRQIEDLKRQLRVYLEEASGDLKATSQRFDESFKEAMEKHTDSQILQDIISLNTQMVKGIERRKLQAMQGQFRNELEHMKIQLLEYKHTATVLEAHADTNTSHQGNVTNPLQHQRVEEEANVNPERNPVNEESTDTTAREPNIGRTFLNSFNDSVRRAHDLGYSDHVIREVVLSNTLQVQYSCKETFQAQINSLADECRHLKGELANVNELLQLTLPAFGFKQSLMSQLEVIFESKGDTIPEDIGYKKEVIKRVMDISRRISHEDGLKLEQGYKDVPATMKVKRDRTFLILRLFYLENLTSDTLIRIEEFVSKKLACINRKDLDEMRRDTVAPRNPLQQVHQELINEIQMNWEAERRLRPEITDLLNKYNAKLSDNEMKSLKEKLPPADNCPDEELLDRLVHLNLQKLKENKETFVQFMREIFTDLNREDIFIEFQNEYMHIFEGFIPVVREILRNVSSKLSKKQKEKFRTSLSDQTKCKDADDILSCMALEHLKGDPKPTIGQLSVYLKTIFGEIGKPELYDEFMQQVEEKWLPPKPTHMFMQSTQSVQRETVGFDRLILEKLQEICDKIDSKTSGQTGAETNLDIMNQVPLTRDNARVDEANIRTFFDSTINSRRQDSASSREYVKPNVQLGKEIFPQTASDSP